MIHGSLDQWKSFAVGYDCLVPGFCFLQSCRPTTLRNGRHPINGKNLFVDVHRYTTQPLVEGQFEVHRRYADIQYLASGREAMMLDDPTELRITRPYDEETDAQLYAPDPQRKPYHLVAQPGDFVVFFPGETHMAGRTPPGGPSDVIKFVVKVLVPPTLEA
jgi:biofilm protein TabA